MMRLGRFFTLYKSCARSSTTACATTSAAGMTGTACNPSAPTSSWVAARSVKVTVHADAIRSAGVAAGTLAELLTLHAAAVDLSGVALVVRAQQR
jgi:hypothetical protein